MTRDDLLEQLLCERYGATPAMRSRHPTPAEVLAFEAMTTYDQARGRRRALAAALGFEDDYEVEKEVEWPVITHESRPESGATETFAPSNVTNSGRI